MPFGVLTIVVSSQSGASFGTRFWKNDEPVGTVREPLHEGRPSAHRPHQRLGETEVVVDEIELRLAVLGKEDLVGVRDRDLTAIDLENLFRVFGHAETLSGRDD